MPILSTDAGSLVFSAANQQWIVKQGVIVANTADNTPAVAMGETGGQLFNHGDISSTGAGVFGAPGVSVTGAGGTIINGQTGSIIGQLAIASQANDTRIYNDGTIKGLATVGILLDIFTVDPEVRNTGHIYGHDVAIKGDTVSGGLITNSGTIESDGVAISLDLYEGTARILNTGTIAGGTAGITSNAFGAADVENDGKIIGDVRLDTFYASRVINSGVIRGDLHLSGNDDTYNGRGGKITGEVYGGGGEDMLRGGGNDDVFYGGDQADVLKGRGGDDVLVGGARGDKLKGGGGADSFVYEDISDSKGGFFAAHERDTILDFKAGKGDRIDLRPIDAKSGGGNQKFSFIGTSDFTGKKGELRYYKDSGNAFVQADVNGDAKVDLEIKLKDVSKLDASDFHL